MGINYINSYKQRVLKGADNFQQLEKLRTKRGFKKYLESAMTSEDRYVTDVGEPCITDSTKKIRVAITDVSNNDATSLDEKNLYTEADANVDVGCYVRIRDVDWLITYEEFQPVGAKKHFIMRRCNHYIKIKFKGVYYEIPTSIENLTMYSDGVADNAYMSFMDSKKQIWYGNNEITRTMGENFRVLLPHRTAFRITHINDFEYRGLIKSLVLQTAMLEGDDVENCLADNSLFYKRDYLENKTEDKKRVENKILGDRRFIVGEQKEFTINSKDNIEWVLEDSTAFTIISESENNIVISGAKNMKLIGSSTKLKVVNKDSKKVVNEITLLLRG